MIVPGVKTTEVSQQQKLSFWQAFRLKGDYCPQGYMIIMGWREEEDFWTV